MIFFFLLILRLLGAEDLRPRYFFRHYSISRPGPNKINPKGEDAYFSNESFMVVADGVGSWGLRGIDPSIFSNKLVNNSKEYFESDPDFYTTNLRLLGAKALQGITDQGSSTLVMVALEKNRLLLHTNNIGDSGYMILRLSMGKYRVVYKSKEQSHQFNFPFQLGGEASDDPMGSVVLQHELRLKDLILVASDGLFDNLFNWDIERIVNRVFLSEGTNIE